MTQAQTPSRNEAADRLRGHLLYTYEASSTVHTDLDAALRTERLRVVEQSKTSAIHTNRYGWVVPISALDAVAGLTGEKQPATYTEIERLDRPGNRAGLSGEEPSDG